MNEVNNKIVYLHLLDGVVVYVGSGSKNRFKERASRLPEHMAVWGKLNKIIYKDNLSIDEAKDLEQELLNQHWDSGNLFNKCKTTNKVLPIVFDELDKLFYYDETSPTCLRRKIDRGNGTKAGDVAGSLRTDKNNKYYKGNNYYEVSAGTKSLCVHRVVYCLMSGKDLDRSLVIDHIDGVGTNNKISNLRAVTQSENLKNKTIKPSNINEFHITEYVHRKIFVVFYKENGSEYKFNFSYTPTGKLDNPRAFRDRDLALAAAIKYRDELIALGKIYKVKQ